MIMEEFVGLVITEKKAYGYLEKYCWEKGHKKQAKFCPRCKAKRPYLLGEARMRCRRCKYTFHSFTGRWIGRMRLSPIQWLWIIKLFELEVSGRKAANQLGISYPSLHKAFMTIRKAIVGEDEPELLNGEVEADEAYFGGRRRGKRGRGAYGKIPVFGLLERRGNVSVNIVKDVSAESLLKEQVKKVKRGSIVYTDKFKSYDSLVFCGYHHLNVNHRRGFTRGEVHINSLEGFWSYAKERLLKHHGVDPYYFPLYLKEMEFRYNNRHKDLFVLLIEKLTNLVPNHL
jgi:transposase